MGRNRILNVIQYTYRSLQYTETGGHSLIRNEKLEYYLRYIGDPCYEINIWQRKGFINQIPVSRTIHEVSQKIVSKCNEYIQFPSTLLQLRRPSTNLEYDFHSSLCHWCDWWNFNSCTEATSCIPSCRKNSDQEALAMLGCLQIHMLNAS